MSVPLKSVPRYVLDHVSGDDVKRYVIVCIFCGHEDVRELPKMVSTGFYFTNPIMCPKCSKWAKYYSGGSIKREKIQPPGEQPTADATGATTDSLFS